MVTFHLAVVKITTIVSRIYRDRVLLPTTHYTYIPTTYNLLPIYTTYYTYVYTRIYEYVYAQKNFNGNVKSF